MEHKDEQLFTALAAAAQPRVKDLNSQELATTAWALARVEYKDKQLFTALAAAAQRQMTEFKSQNIGNTLWALATMHHTDKKLFKALTAAAHARMKEFNSQSVANTAWAFTTVMSFLFFLYKFFGHRRRRRWRRCTMGAAAVELSQKFLYTEIWIHH